MSSPLLRPVVGDARQAAALVGRRTVLAGMAGAVVLGAGPATAATTTPVSPKVRRRTAWGDGLPPTGRLEEERPRDVRFVLVHHTASANGYSRASVADQLRGIYRYHTGSKGWPDVAYNFFVDRFGRIWEGRTGSLDGPVKGSATGGSQGFALLCCFLGNLDRQRPSPEARRAMTVLVAALADRYGIDTSPDATTTFVSRGSNRWPRGDRVTTPTIAGHRDMSLTACPGRFGYRFVTGGLREGVADLRSANEISLKLAEAPRQDAAAGSVEGSASEGGPAPQMTPAPATAPATAISPATASAGESDMTVPVAVVAGSVVAAAVGAGVAASRSSTR